MALNARITRLERKTPGMTQDNHQTQFILDMLDDVLAKSKAKRAAAGLPPHESKLDIKRLLEENLARSGVARR